MKPVIFNFPTPNITAVCNSQPLLAPGNAIINGTYSTQYIPNPTNPLLGNYQAFSWQNTTAAIFNGFSSSISIASTNDLSLANFTITGFLDGFPVSETIAGPVGTGGPDPVIVSTDTLFSIVTSVSVDSAVADFSVGTWKVGKVNWFGYDHYKPYPSLSIQVDTSTATYSFITTLDDVQKTPYSQILTFTPITAMTAAITDQLALYSAPANYCGIIISDMSGGPVNGVPTGSVKATFVQQGLA